MTMKYKRKVAARHTQRAGGGVQAANRIRRAASGLFRVTVHGAKKERLMRMSGGQKIPLELKTQGFFSTVVENTVVRAQASQKLITPS